jgi:hypothetical protein
MGGSTNSLAAIGLVFEFIDACKSPRPANNIPSTKLRWDIALIVFNFFLSVNFDNTVGAIGFVSRILPAVYPIAIIRADPQTGDPVRDTKGLCIQCKPGKCNFKCCV